MAWSSASDGHMDLQYSVKDAMSIEETEALIRGQSSPTDSRLTPVLRPRLKKYRTRFYILFSFALIGMCQCMNCFTLTSLPDSTEEYFGITQAELIFIFNWQPLANTVGALFASALYSTLGTKWTVRLLALLASAGPALRCVPSLVPAVKASRDLTLLCLHASSIINGCGGPILNSAPALISAIWFPAKERMTATGILGTCPVLGSMVGFFIGPRIVHHASGGWDSSKRHRRMIARHVTGACVDTCMLCIPYARGSIPLTVCRHVRCMQTYRSSSTLKHLARPRAD